MYSEVPCCLVYCGDNYDLMAEREGFEPPKDFRPCRFSRPVPSTTRPPLRLLQFYYSARILKRSSTASACISNRLRAHTLSVEGFSRPPVSTAHTSLQPVDDHQFTFDPA